MNCLLIVMFKREGKGVKTTGFVRFVPRVAGYERLRVCPTILYKRGPIG